MKLQLISDNLIEEADFTEWTKFLLKYNLNLDDVIDELPDFLKNQFKECEKEYGEGNYAEKYAIAMGAATFWFCKYKFSLENLVEKDHKIQLLEDEIKGLKEIIEIANNQ